MARHDPDARPETFRLLDKEVLSQGRRALVIIGNGHLLRRSPLDDFQPRPLDNAGLADALAQRYPGKAFLVWTVDGDKSGSASRLASWRPGTLAQELGFPRVETVNEGSGQVVVIFGRAE
ncbi:hypothetical protein F0U60_15160 [Archangium minus]|uniref:Uncharacterized protein n=1 Tax=Archangium minus TaxID=83450 RepID=A0ABY9WRC7_9BACT|nr:hypothetical protein F0U61_15160 [Archangium violaceum]WNG45296.1 hypothetical protein F0U60_15160 [Archangium minus]